MSISKHFLQIVKEENIQDIESFLSRGYSDLNIRDDNSNTALSISVLNENAEIVQILVSWGCDVNTKDKDGYSPIMRASMNGLLEIANILLSTNKCDLNVQLKDGCTALYLACSRGHTDIVRALISAGSDVLMAKMTIVGAATFDLKAEVKEDDSNSGGNISNNISLTSKVTSTSTNIPSATAAISSTISRHTMRVSYCDVNLANHDGCTPLIKACSEGHTDIVRLIIDANCDLNSKDKYGHSALMKAAELQFIDTVNLLITANCDLNIRDRYGHTAVMKACEKEFTDIVRVLCVANCDVNNRDASGVTALIHASEQGYTEIVRIISGTGSCDVNLRDKKSRSALLVAKNQTIAVLLLETGSGMTLASASEPSYVDNGNRKKPKVSAAGTGDRQSSEPDSGGKNRGNLSFKDAADQIVREVSQSKLTTIDPVLTRPAMKELLKARDRKWDLFLGKVFLHYAFFPDRGNGVAAAAGSQTLSPEGLVVWFWMLSQTEDKFTEELAAMLDKYINNVNYLLTVTLTATSSASSTFEVVQRAVDIATQKYRLLLREKSYFMGKYEFQRHSPKRVSDHCQIFIATDHGGSDTSKGSLFGGIDVTRKVIMKFINLSSKYELEMELRQRYRWDSKYIVELIEAFSAESNTQYRATAKRWSVYPYCLVLEAGDCDLREMVTYENATSGRDWLLFQHITRCCLSAVQYLHDLGLVHGDLKPEHIVRFKTPADRSTQQLQCGEDKSTTALLSPCAVFATACTYKLISLSGVTSHLTRKTIGHKVSAAYVPPEAITLHPASTTAFIVRAPAPPLAQSVVPATTITGGSSSDTSDGPSFSHLIADPSFDLWSLGATLYFVYTNEPLFRSDITGRHMSGDQLELLYTWSGRYKQQRLAGVSNSAGCNLIRKLLMKSPSERSHPKELLHGHPFLTHAYNIPRVLGEPYTYDVCLSYRSGCGDTSFVDAIRRLLVASSLSVHACAVSGMTSAAFGTAGTGSDGSRQRNCQTESELVGNLLKCRYYLPVLSKAAICSDIPPACALSKLSVNSSMDSLFLQLRLAMELQQQSYLEAILPICLTDSVPDANSTSASELTLTNDCWLEHVLPGSTLSGSGSELPGVRVLSVESKLESLLASWGLVSGYSDSPETVTVRYVLKAVTGCNGGYIIDTSNSTASIASVCDSIITRLLTVKDGEERAMATPTRNFRPNSRESLRQSAKAKDALIASLRNESKLMEACLARLRQLLESVVLDSVRGAGVTLTAAGPPLAQKGIVAGQGKNAPAAQASTVANNRKLPAIVQPPPTVLSDEKDVLLSRQALSELYGALVDVAENRRLLNRRGSDQSGRGTVVGGLGSGDEGGGDTRGDSNREDGSEPASPNLKISSSPMTRKPSPACPRRPTEGDKQGSQPPLSPARSRRKSSITSASSVDADDSNSRDRAIRALFAQLEHIKAAKLELELRQLQEAEERKQKRSNRNRRGVRSSRSTNSQRRQIGTTETTVETAAGGIGFSLPQLRPKG